MEEAIIDSTHGFNVYCKFDRYMSVEELSEKKHKLNRNRHSKPGVIRLAKSMAEPQIGVRHPIVISMLSDQIVSGHKRLQATIQNGWTHFPVQFQTFVSEESEYAHLQGDNGHGQDSELDLSGIHQDLENLSPVDLDFLGVDFQFEPKPQGKKFVKCPSCSEEFPAKGNYA